MSCEASKYGDAQTRTVGHPALVAGCRLAAVLVSVSRRRCHFHQGYLCSGALTTVSVMEGLHHEDVSRNDEIGGFQGRRRYEPPAWASHLGLIPSHVFNLGHLPTPIHKWNLPNVPEGTEVWIKRDDLSGMQLSGNKVRKLEFLLADAVGQGADCVITVGGIQSNHCCATAVAARYLNLDAYLILITTERLVNEDPGLTGNLLVERLVGAHVELITMEDYIEIGGVSWGLVHSSLVRTVKAVTLPAFLEIWERIKWLPIYHGHQGETCSKHNGGHVSSRNVCDVGTIYPMIGWRNIIWKPSICKTCLHSCQMMMRKLVNDEAGLKLLGPM